MLYWDRKWNYIRIIKMCGIHSWQSKYNLYLSSAWPQKYQVINTDVFCNCQCLIFSHFICWISNFTCIKDLYKIMYNSKAHHVRTAWKNDFLPVNFKFIFDYCWTPLILQIPNQQQNIFDIGCFRVIQNCVQILYAKHLYWLKPSNIKMP
jgi:hypothetical protein